MGHLMNVRSLAGLLVVVLLVVLLPHPAAGQSGSTPVPSRIPIEEAMRKYNAAFMVISQLDGNGDYDASIPQKFYPWPESWGCGDGLIETPPKPKNGWYGPDVYENPEEALFLVRSVAYAFYEGEPIVNGGPLYEYFIDPARALDNNVAAWFTESDFPLTWLSGDPDWTNAGGIENAVTRENYREAMAEILGYINKLGGRELGGDAYQAIGPGIDAYQTRYASFGDTPEERFYNAYHGVVKIWLEDQGWGVHDNSNLAPDTPRSSLPQPERDWKIGAQIFNSINVVPGNPPGYNSTGVGFGVSSGAVGISAAELSTIAQDKTLHIFMKGVDIYSSTGGVGLRPPYAPGQLESYVSHNVPDYPTPIPMDAKWHQWDSGPVPASGPFLSKVVCEGWSGTAPNLIRYDMNSGGQWRIEEVGFLVSDLPELDDSPSPADSSDDSNPEDCCGGSPGAETGQDPDTGDPEFSVNAGSDEPSEENSQFYAEMDEPDPGVSDPDSLTDQIADAVSNGTNQHITDSNGHTIQIMNGDWNGGSPNVRSLVHFNETLTDGYAIEFYGDATWDATNSDWDPVGNAFRKVTVQDLSSGSDGTHVRVSDATIDESTGNTVDQEVTDYTWDATNQRWVMAKGVNPSTGVALRKQWIEIDTSSNKTVTRMVTSDNTSEVVSKVIEVYSKVGGFERMIERSTVSDTTNGETSLVETWVYYANGQLERYGTDRGDWVYYEYDDDGAVSKMVRSLEDEGEYDPSDSNGNEPGNLVTTQRDQYTDLSDIHTNDGVEVIRESIELIEDAANPGTMIPVSTTYTITWSYDSVNGTEYELWEIVCASPDPKAGYAGADDEAKTTAFLNALVADADYLGHYVTKSIFATPGEDYRFKMVRTEYPDGKVSLRDRSETGSIRTRVSEQGFPTRDVNGNITGIAHGTRHTTTVNESDGSMTMKLERIVRGGGWITISYSETTAQDSLGRPTNWDYYYGVKAASPGTNAADYSSSKVFDHHRLSSQTDRRGLTTEYDHDVLGQVTRMDLNVGTSGALRIESDYDPAGRVEATYRQGLDSLGATTTSKLMDQQFVFDEAGRLSSRTDGAGVKMFYTHNRVAEDGSAYVVGTSTGPMYDEQRVYPHDRSAGPINVSRYNRLGQLVMQYQAKPTSPTYDWNGNAPSAIEALTPLSRTVYEYDWRGVQIADRTYFEIASLSGLSDKGTEGTNYLRTEIFAISHLGSLLREADETGTISAYVYDSAGRLIEQWLGTDDSGATASDPSGAGSNNMALVAKHLYDDSRDGTGDLMDYRTRLEYIKPSLASLSGTSSDFTGTDYELLLAAGSETGWSKPDHGPWSATTQTHDDRVIEAIDTQNGSTTTLLAKRTWQYDISNNRPWRLENGRAYETTGGSAGAYVETAYEYDDAQRQTKELHSRGGFTVTEYDAFGRSWRFLKHADANTVLTQDETFYDNADRAVAIASMARYHDDTTTVGSLSKTNSVLSVLVNRYDSGGRLERTVDFGQDNGSTRYVFDTQGDLIDADSDGIPNEAESTSTLRDPDTSDDYRVSVTTFDERGLTNEVERNDGRKTRYSYDAMGRRVSMIENYIDGTPGTDDSDRITKWTFNSVGQSKTVEAQLATGTIQTQTYVYSSELTDKGSPVSRNDLLRAMIHADSDDSVASNQLNDNAGGYDREEYTYLANGQVYQATDKSGVIFTHYYTGEGWLHGIELAGVVAGSTWTIDDNDHHLTEYIYGDAGELNKVWTFNSTFSDVTSEIEYTYDGFYNRLTETQDHDPMANSGAGIPKTISWSYDTTNSGGQYTNGYRLDTVTYPSGRVVQLDYSGHSGIDDAIGRVTKLQEYNGGGANDTDIVAYDNLGSSAMVRKRYPGPGVRLDMLDEGSEGTSIDDPYDASWTRFGQAKRYQWEKFNTSTGAGEDDILHIEHGYDRSARRLYDGRKVYTGFSRTFDHDQLDRVTEAERGILVDNAGTKEIDWLRRSEVTSLDALGNPTQIDRETQSPYTQNITHNDANELDTREVYEKAASSRVDDDFSSSATASDWDIPGSDAFSITGGHFQPTSVTADLIDGTTESSAHGIYLWGPELGPLNSRLFVTFDASITSTTRAGVVFGYEDAHNYWLAVLKYVPGGQSKTEICQVVNGVLTVRGSSNRTITGGSETFTYIGSTRKLMQNHGAIYTFSGGFPAGRIGLYTDSTQVKFNSIQVSPHDEPSDLAGRWDRHSPVASYSDGIRVSNSADARHYPTFLRGVTLPASQHWRTTVMLTRSSSTRNWDGLRFLFNVRDRDTYSALSIHHADITKSPGSATEFVDGTSTSLSGTQTPANVVTVANQSDQLWARIEYNGTDVSVKLLVDNSGAPTDTTWSGTGVAYATSNFDMTGGQIGFRAVYGAAFVKHVKVETDADNNGTFVTEYEDDISAWANYEPIQHEYDAAGNMTYDGEKSYTYNSQNRLMMVSNAYRAPGSGNVVNGSPIAEYVYDARGRRIEEKAYVGGVIDTHLHHYYLGWSIIETRDNYAGTGGPRLLTQYVWDNLAGHYTDSLAEVGHNVNLASGPGDNTIDRRFYALQDQQYNLMALVDEGGDVVERYEYSLHGKRQVFKRAGYSAESLRSDINRDGRVREEDVLPIFLNWGGTGKTHQQGDLDGDGDADNDDTQYIYIIYYDSSAEWYSTDPPTELEAHTASSTSDVILSSGVPLCRVGFTGQFHDPATGLVHMRNRDYVPALGRFLTRDPAGDVDGQNMYVGHFATALGTDPLGLFTTKAAARQIRAAAQEAGSLSQQINIQSMMLGQKAQQLQALYGDCPIDWEYFSGEYEALRQLDTRYHNAIFRGFEAYLATVENQGTAGLVVQNGIDGLRQTYGGGDTAGQAMQELYSYGYANGFFEYSEDEDYVQAKLGRYSGYFARLGDASARNTRLANASYEVAWYADKVAMAASIGVGGWVAVAKVGIQAGVCGTLKGLAVGYVSAELLELGVRSLDLNPHLVTAISVAQVAIAALSTKRACFPEGTLVWVQDEVTGELVAVPIETIEIGQRVWSYDPDTGQWQYCEVAETYELPYDGEFADVTYIVNGMGPLTETISATGNHPFWVQSAGRNQTALTHRPLALHHTGEDAEYLGPNGGRWVQARHLTPGDQLLLKEGRSATVCGLTVRTERTRVYNFNVLELRNYAVGIEGVLVHNANYTNKSRSHLSDSKHHANSTPTPGKSRFKPTEGGQKFTDEVVNHPNTTRTVQNNGRVRHDNNDLGRQTGTGPNGQPVRGGRVVEEGPNPHPNSPNQPGDVVTQFPQ